MHSATRSVQSIAVVGGGISGVVCCHLLQRRHQVTLYEKNGYVGGHTHTVVIQEGPDAGLPVDTGFIVFNDRTYPNLMAFFRELGVTARKTDMAFSYTHRPTNFCFGSTQLKGLLAQPRNAASFSFWRFLVGIASFGHRMRRDLASGRLRSETLATTLERFRVHPWVKDRFAVPMASSIWSTPNHDILNFPSEAIARFYDHHGLLTFRDRPSWYFVEGGSHAYVKAFLARFQGEVRLNCAVTAVRRTPEAVWVTDTSRETRRFDAIVFASHADETIQMIQDLSREERELLAPWRYARNRTVLHQDPRFMPPCSRAWASWNYLDHGLNGSGNEAKVSLTYYMNRLQALPTRGFYGVTLNPPDPRPLHATVRDLQYSHPMYTFAALETQNRLPQLNGRNRTYFCGAYFGNGFHEDGVNSALAVASHFGIGL